MLRFHLTRNLMATSALSMLCGIFLIFSLSANAQQVHVVTKKVEASYPYKDGYELNLEGEKAEIRVEAWDKAEVGVEIDMISRHPDKAVAEKALEYINHKIERVGNKIYIRNFLSGDSNPDQNAQLHVKYFIRVPAQCPVYVKNIYGLATFRNLEKSLRIFSQFTRLGIENMKGELNVTTRFGDLEGQHLDGQIQIESRRSDILLSHLSGNVDLNTYYGKITLSELEELLSLNIQAEKSDIFLQNIESQKFGYLINASNASLNLPASLPFDFAEGSDGMRKASYKPAKEFYPGITITLRLGSLNINR